MKKKLIYIILIVSSLFFIKDNLYFIFERTITMVSKTKIIGIYNYNLDVNSSFNVIADSVILFFNDFWLNIKNIFIFIFSSNNLIIFANLSQIVVILYACLQFWVIGSNLKYSTSILAIGLIKVISFCQMIVKSIYNFIEENKKEILLIILFFSGIIFVIIYELFIFLLDYIVHMFSLSSYLVMLDLLKWIIVKFVEFVTTGNKFIVISFFIILYFVIAFSLAWKKIRINWACFKRLIRDSATINMVEGEPGAGKTLTLVHAQIAYTEIMLDEFDELILEFELKNPTFNFAKLRLMLKIFFLDFEEFEIDNIIKTCPNILFDFINLNEFIDSDITKYYFNYYYRGTCMATLIPVVDPYFDSMSRIAKIQTMRFFKELSEFPYEPYMTMALPEFDKEFNSHDSKEDVSDDGTFAFFALMSHLMDRCGHVWLDAQDKNQTIKRIRGVAGAYYHLEKRKVCMPFMIKIIYKPLLSLYNSILKLLLDYLGYRPKTEKKLTVRRKQRIYKRNNLSFLYQLFKYIALGLNSIVGYLERFQYFRITAEFATNDEYRHSKLIRYNLNVMDFEHNGKKVYNSTQFKKFYDDLKNVLYRTKGIKQNLMLLDKWSSIEPDILEFAKTGQRNYVKIVRAQFKENGSE